MASLDTRDTDVAHLHPAIRDLVGDLVEELQGEGHPFAIFEAFRSPNRQRYLYAQGRTTPGPKVTKAPPWSSYHQYGLAADFVLRINGRWSWSSAGADARHWQALHEAGRRRGLEPLSWEMPHLQLGGLSIEDLQRGLYPAGGDDDWADNLEAAIASWSGAQHTPPPPRNVARPPLVGVARDEEPERFEVAPDRLPMAEQDAQGELARPAVPQTSRETTMLPNQFARIQEYIDKWEGGYVDDPADPGGATNMGITIATLQRWRGKPVTKADVKALTRSEQRQIMKAFYYDVVRGDDLPAAIAALVYNAAVLHGPSRSATFLQQSLRAAGETVAVDGAIGRETLGAAAAADHAKVVDLYLQIEEAFLRSLSHFSRFGKGWLNRLEDVGAFARSLLLEQSAYTGLVDVNGPDLQREAGLLAGNNNRGNGLTSSGAGALLPEAFQPGTPEPLTKVNAALGQGIGRLLNGRKTFLGVVGAALGTMLPTVAPALGLLTGAHADLTGSVVTPLSLALAAWGVMGRGDKWAAAEAVARNPRSLR